MNKHEYISIKDCFWCSEGLENFPIGMVANIDTWKQILIDLESDYGEFDTIETFDKNIEYLRSLNTAKEIILAIKKYYGAEIIKYDENNMQLNRLAKEYKERWKI